MLSVSFRVGLKSRFRVAGSALHAARGGETPRQRRRNPWIENFFATPWLLPKKPISTNKIKGLTAHSLLPPESAAKIFLKFPLDPLQSDTEIVYNAVVFGGIVDSRVRVGLLRTS